MARTRLEIQESIQNILVDEMAAIGVTIQPTSWSKTNLFRLCCFVFAFCGHVMENIFDVFKSDVDGELRERFPHSLRFYANILKKYMHGHSTDELGEYDITGLTAEQIESARIVKYCAVVEQENDNGRMYLNTKLAGFDGDDLIQLTNAEVSGVRIYMNTALKDAGVRMLINSWVADSAKMHWKIYYNPLVLDGNGNRVDGTAEDVARLAIKEYLKQIDFNGVYARQKHEDFVQKIEGIELCPLVTCQYKYGAYDWIPIDVKVIPYSGYLRFISDADLTIEYIANV